MGNEIEKLAQEIIEKYRDKHDSGRANELENSVRISLHKLANRIDRGYHIEVRIGELPEPEDEDDKTDEDLQSVAEEIHRAAKKLQFIRLEGEPIPSLPEESPKKSVAKKTSTKKNNKSG